MLHLPRLPVRFVLISRWRLGCSSADAFTLLTDVDRWPQWWPNVRRVVRTSDEPPDHETICLQWRTPLGYGFRITVRTTRRVRLPDGRCEIEGSASGYFTGRGLWLLDPLGDDAVDVTYRWEVELDRPWMRRFAPLLRGVFEWNHFMVMRAGARGMARRLGCEVAMAPDWSGGPA